MERCVIHLGLRSYSGTLIEGESYFVFICLFLKAGLYFPDWFLTLGAETILSQPTIQGDRHEPPHLSVCCAVLSESCLTSVDLFGIKKNRDNNTSLKWDIYWWQGDGKEPAIIEYISIYTSPWGKCFASIHSNYKLCLERRTDNPRAEPRHYSENP